MSTRPPAPDSPPDALRGELVRLRPPVEADLDRFFAEQDWEGMRLGHGGPPVPSTRQATEEWLFRPFDEGTLTFVVEQLDHPEPVGRIGLSAFQWPEAVAMLGMHLFSAQRGKGYGTDALRVLCAFGFDQLNLHKISLGTWEYNEHARSLYRRMGFVEEGRERDYLFRDGRYHDSIAMGLLRSEWRARQEPATP